VGVLGVTLMLLGNHLLSWGSFFLFIVQGDNFWEVGVTLVIHFNVKCLGSLKGNWDYMSSNVKETRSNIQVLVFGKSCV
jgi:hypothetical protein